jgi:sigma-B regulation protein RsbU (phosphoserine phosphatase)
MTHKNNNSDREIADDLNNSSWEKEALISASSLDANVLATYPIFQDIPPDLIVSLLAQCQIGFLRAGEILLTPGDENHYLYWLLSGHLQVYLVDSGGSTIDKQMGFMISPGESIGEMSIIENKPVSAQVIAQEDCHLLVMPEQVFWKQLVCVPGVVKNLLQGLSLRIRKRDEIALKNLEQQLKFEHLQKDLVAASKIQSNILPHQNPLFPNHPQVDAFATVKPAKEVGGDFFDAFPLDENHFCIAIGDVSGKGIPAALFMIRVITLLRLSISRINSLQSTVESINRHLCESNDDCMFVTLFVGIFDVISGQLTYVNGGHNWPFFSSKGHCFTPLEVPGGMLLGISEEAQYKAAELIFQPGDTLVLYTDGVTEAEDKDGNFFSSEQTCQVLNAVHKHATSMEIATVLKEAVFEFSACVPQSDDMTILVLRYRAAETKDSPDT